MIKDPTQKLPAGWVESSAMFIALGDPQRQRILLFFEPGERLNAGQIAAGMPISRTAVSHHLKILRQAGALIQERSGKEIFYQVNHDAISGVLNRVLDYIRNNS